MLRNCPLIKILSGQFFELELSFTQLVKRCRQKIVHFWSPLATAHPCVRPGRMCHSCIGAKIVLYACRKHRRRRWEGASLHASRHLEVTTLRLDLGLRRARIVHRNSILVVRPSRTAGSHRNFDASMPYQVTMAFQLGCLFLVQACCGDSNRKVARRQRRGLR